MHGTPLDAQLDHWETMLGNKPDRYGRAPSDPARRSARVFQEANARRLIELGSGQGRDTVFFAEQGFQVLALDYTAAGVEATRLKATEAGLGDRVEALQHDVRSPLPCEDGAFEGCFSHMLFCMALTRQELAALSQEVWRVLAPGGVCVYTARHTGDPDHGIGRAHGEGLYEDEGFIVHFFDRTLVEELAHGFEILAIEEFEEGPLPRRLFRVVLRKPAG